MCGSSVPLNLFTVTYVVIMIWIKIGSLKVKKEFLYLLCLICILGMSYWCSSTVILSHRVAGMGYCGIVFAFRLLIKFIGGLYTGLVCFSWLICFVCFLFIVDISPYQVRSIAVLPITSSVLHLSSLSSFLLSFFFFSPRNFYNDLFNFPSQS